MGAVSTALPRLHVRMCIYIYMHREMHHWPAPYLRKQCRGHSASFTWCCTFLYLQYQSIIFLQFLAIQSSSVGSVCLLSCLMFLVLSRVICTQSVSLHQSVISDKSHPAFYHSHGKSLYHLSHSIILELQIKMARLTMVINHAADNIPS